MDKWNEHQDDGSDNIDEMYETLYANESFYQDMSTSRNAILGPSTSPREVDSQEGQNDATVGVEENSKKYPARTINGSYRELSRRIDHPLPGCGQGPTAGGLPASFCPLSECGGIGGQSPILSFQQELMKREMNQQLVQYHLPAQMQATMPQTRIYEDLRFRGPGGSEAAGASRGASSDISDPTAPKISEDTQMREELPVAELSVLLKFLQTLGDLPKIELGDPASRGERLVVWRTAVEDPVTYNEKGGDGLVEMVLRRSGDLLQPLA